MSRPHNPRLFEFAPGNSGVQLFDTEVSLRDLFAAAALCGFMSKNALRFTPQDDADYCYRIADAMLKARETNGG